MLRARAAVILLLVVGGPVAVAAPVGADTATSLGDRSGEGSKQFTGLSQTAEAMLFTGAATTRIDLQLPPARMMPELALVYSSFGAASPFGLGWDLPIGRIERSAKWGVPGCTGATNEFVLSLPSGSVELANDPPGTDTYRARFDDGFVEAIRFEGQNRWEVLDRTGMKYVFGATPSARAGTDIDQFMVLDGSQFCRFTSVWALSSVEDTHGNRMDVTWDSIANVLYPSVIEYGANPQQGVSSHPYRIQFAYELRPDIVTSSLSGAPSELTRRAAAIFVQTMLPSPTLVRTYSLVYDAEADNVGYQSRLNHVGIGGYGTNLDFAYAHGMHGHGASEAITSPAGYSALRATDGGGEVRRTLLDMTGDGIVDLVNYNGGSPWKIHRGFLGANGAPGGFALVGESWALLQVAGDGHPNFIRRVAQCETNVTCTMRDTFDITGDGIPDHVVAATTPWTVYPGERPGSGTIGRFLSPIAWQSPHPYVRRDVRTGSAEVGSSRTRQDTVDVNGDGRPDLVVAPGGLGQAPFMWSVYLNTGNGFASTPLPFFQAPSQFVAFQVRTATNSGYVTQQLADIDGDGVLDFLIERPLLGGLVYECETDADGDGVAETPTKCLDVYRGTGQGFESTPRTFPLPHFLTAPANYGGGTQIRGWIGGETRSDLVDVNGDGFPDLVGVDGGGTWRVFLNSGGEIQSHGPALNWSVLSGGAITGPLRQTHLGSAGESWDVADMIDLDGDGMLDRVRSVNGGTWTVQRNQNPARPNLLTVIRNGMNGTTTLRYQPSTIYDNTGGDGKEDLPNVTWVVDGIRRSDGLCDPGGADPFSAANPCISSGHEVVTELVYQDGRFDPVDREFRGFRLVFQVHRNDPAAGARNDNTTNTIFAQTREIKGRILRTDRYAGNAISGPSKLVASTENVWNAAPIGGTTAGRQQIWLSKTTTAQDYTSGTSLSSAHVVERYQSRPDAYGNVERVRTAARNGSDCVATVTSFATPFGTTLWNKPAHTISTYSSAADSGDMTSCGAAAIPFVEKWFYYDGASNGFLTRGDVTKVESAVDGSGARVAVKMAYDGFGNVVDSWDELDRQSHTDYDAYGLFAVTERNPLGHEVHTTTDYRWGRPIAVTDPNGQTTCYGYDSAGRPSYVVRPPDAPPNCAGADTATKWQRFAYGYATGNVGEQLSWVRVEQREPGQGAPGPTTGYRAHTEYFDALARPRVKKTTRMVGSAASCDAIEYAIFSGDTEYDAGGRVAARYDSYLGFFGLRNNGATVTTYALNGSQYIDPLGRPHTVTRPDNGISGAGRTVRSEYGRDSTTTYDPEGNKTVERFDAYRRVTTREAYKSNSKYTWTDTTYDGAGRVLTTKLNNKAATTVTNTYDRLGRKLSSTVPNTAGIWTYRYDAVGNLIFQNDPKPGQHVELCYDALNRVTKKFYFDNDTQQSPDCAAGAAIEYAYDDRSLQGGLTNQGIGRLTSVTDRSGAASYRYDARGRRVAETRTVDFAGVATSATVTYDYDEADRVWRTHYPGGEYAETAYDATGQPYSLLRVAGATTEPIIACAAYDVFGRQIRLEHDNGVVDTASHHAAPFSLVNDHWLKTRRVETTGGVRYLNLEYDQYDRRGLLTSIVDHELGAPQHFWQSVDFTYDFLGRLTAATGDNVNELYEHDALGNLTALGGLALKYTDSSRPHQVTKTVRGGMTTDVLHDANGNRRAKDNEAQVYTFDEDDRVETITVAGPPSAVMTMAYDHAGRKTAQHTQRGSFSMTVRYYNPLVETDGYGTGSLYTRFYYFGGQRVAARRSSDSGWETAGLFGSNVRVVAAPGDRPALVVLLAPSAQLAALGGLAVVALALAALPGRRRRVVGLRVSRRGAAGTTLLWVIATLPLPLILRPDPASGGGGPPHIEWRHFHHDALGSLQVVTDGAGLNIENIRYTPYGELRGRWRADGTTAGVAQAYRYEFTGYETEMGSGLQYAGARFYDPSLGSFLTHDPQAAFPNPYSYLGGDPVNDVDVNGEIPWGLIALAFVVGFAVGTIQAAANGADAGSAFKAGAIAGAVAGATAFGLQVVIGPVVTSIIGAKAYSVALVGSAAYGVADSARTGNYAGLVASVVGLAFAASAAYSEVTQVSQGANGVSGNATAGTRGGACSSSCAIEEYDWGDFLDVRPENGDGTITWGEAVWQRRNGGGTLYQDLDRLDLSGLDVAQFAGPGSRVPFQTAKPFDFLVHGNITLTMNADASISALPDVFDFNVGFADIFGRSPIRNFETIVGRLVAGPGDRVDIIFRGRFYPQSGSI